MTSDLPGREALLAPALAGLISVSMTWGVYRSSGRTRRWQDIVPNVIRDGKAFCVVLRPFGEDGRIALRALNRRGLTLTYGFYRTRTMEQVIARAAKHALNLRSYALVDGRKRLAPPGPQYLRGGREDWRECLGRLLPRAHAIVLIVPPTERLRGGTEWELAFLREHGLADRVVIVLPPSDSYRRYAASVRERAEDMVFGLTGHSIGSILRENTILIRPDCGDQDRTTRVVNVEKRHWAVIARTSAENYYDALMDEILAISYGEGSMGEPFYPGRKLAI